MRRVLIDTNIYTAFKRNHPTIVQSFKHLDFIGIDVTVLAELNAGFKGGNKETLNVRELEDFISTSRVHILYHNDIWIAASSMPNGLAFFTLDLQHFKEIEGLVLKTDY